MVEAIEEVIFPALSLVFLLLGIVLLASILFSAFNPYEQIAIANTEKLRAAMDEACLKGGDVSLNSFTLQQNTPSFTWLLSILPRWLIRSGGDPNYLVYYEAFPPGEAAGWEVYHDFQNRLVVPITEQFLAAHDYAGSSVVDYVKEVVEKYEQRDNTHIDAVIISNIVLSEDFRSDFIFERTGGSVGAGTWEGGPLPEAKTAKEKFFSYGSWGKIEDPETKIPANVNNEFTFSNYLGLSTLEKTSLKYMPCGENSLCLKTRSGIYSYPLTQCTGAKKINAVQLYYHGGENPAVKRLGADLIKLVGGSLAIIYGKVIGGAAGAAAIINGVSDLVELSTSYKLSEFYAASPCSIEDYTSSGTQVTVKRTYCASFVSPACRKSINYPIYKYNAETQKLVKSGDHYVCLDAIGQNMDDLPSESVQDSCIFVDIGVTKDDYCWTWNPHFPTGSETLKRAVTGKPSDIIEWNMQAGAVATLRLTYGLPIHESTNFVKGSADTGDIIVLKPTQTALKMGEKIYEALDRKLGWGWP